MAVRAQSSVRPGQDFATRAAHDGPLALLLALWHWRSGARLDRVPALFPLTAVLYLGLMSLAYVFSDFAPYQQHVVSSGRRLVAHVTHLLGLWMVRSGLTREDDRDRGAHVDG